MLKTDGVLVSRPGVGMVVTTNGLPNRDGRLAMISDTARKLVREAKDLSLEVDDVTAAVSEEWQRDNHEQEEPKNS